MLKKIRNFWVSSGLSLLLFDQNQNVKIYGKFLLKESLQFNKICLSEFNLKS
ncbi:hypothetical protein M595_5090 [Lyngbya aestuarii BL J]|uniref:Uncharacterized protein n=1 Tax=Lyngbya aestuarii BL J TaxID=1348334 RepID=U7QD97_9CYAN|nr:hypothetical protein M595_5090 [Lyngbya aestuarii BL J]